MKRTQTAYEKKTLRQYKFALNRNTETDLIEYLDSIENYRQYIITLIRTDMIYLKASKGSKKDIDFIIGKN